MDPIAGTVLTTIPDPTFENFVYEIGGSPVLGAPGSVFAANYANGNAPTQVGNTLLDFDVNSATIAWQVAGRYPSTPAYANGVLYIVNNKPLQLEARSEVNGALLWSWSPAAADTKFTSETLLTNNMVFVSTDIAVYGIDTTFHAAVWSYPFTGRLALSRNGILYLEGAAPLTAINLK